jgi:cytoskeletal protein CcmA (bactofilin family)
MMPAAFFGRLRYASQRLSVIPQITGTVDFEDVIMECGATFVGTVNANKSHFLQKIKLDGTLNAQESIFAELVVKGKLLPRDVTINGTCQLQGVMQATKTIFKQNVTVDTRTLEFIDSTVSADLIFKPHSQNAAQTLILRNTKITGNVVFEGGNGHVDADGASVILGQVRGIVVDVPAGSRPAL